MKRRLFGLVILVAVTAVVQVSAVALTIERFDPAQGTIEVWIKPSWSYDEQRQTRWSSIGDPGVGQRVAVFVYNQQVWLPAGWPMESHECKTIGDG